MDRVLSFALIEGRPLRHFSTTLLFPFHLEGALKKDVKGPDVVECSSTDYSMQEKLFFLPHVRDFIFQNGDAVRESVRRWLLRPEAKGDLIEVQLPRGEGLPQLIKVPITEVSLYRFFNGLHILSISVSHDTEAKFWETAPLWRVLLDDAFQKQFRRLELYEALTFNKLARLVHPTFPEQQKERKIADVSWKRPRPYLDVTSQLSYSHIEQGQKRELSGVVKAMIGEFLGWEAKVDYEAIPDDRMFVHTCIALAGLPPKGQVGEERYRAMVSLATCVDQVEDGFNHLGGYAYDPEFVNNLLLTYRRWYGVSGNLYGFTRYSAVYLAFGNFFHETVSNHVRTMYLRMSVIAVFYRNSLLEYSRELAKIPQPRSHTTPGREIENYSEKLRHASWNLIRFSNIFWFRELSAQDQPIELFNLQSKAMELDQEYANVKGKIDRAFELVQMGLQSDFGLLSRRLGRIALIFAIISFITGYFSLNFSFIDANIAGSSWAFWTVTASVSALIGLLLFWVAAWWRRARTFHRQSEGLLEIRRK